MKKKEYALYKGDELLAIGTLKELSDKFNVKKETIKFYSSPSYLKRRKNSKSGNYRIVVKLD